MTIPVNFDPNRFILMERKNTSDLVPCVMEKSEFDKFRVLIRIFGDYYKIPDSEKLKVFPMFKNETGEYFVVDNFKSKERANQIDSALWG